MWNTTTQITCSSIGSSLHLESGSVYNLSFWDIQSSLEHSINLTITTTMICAKNMACFSMHIYLEKSLQ